jgi:hypothetical protein
MRQGRVCVAGCDQAGTCIRPTLPHPGIRESSLYASGKPIVFPFALVEYDLTRPVPRPPHVEDWEYVPESVRFSERLDEGRRRTVLEHSLVEGVREVFDAPVLEGPGHFVKEGEGSRSMGTIRPCRVSWTTYSLRQDGRREYRLRFTDRCGMAWDLPVTDLTWRYYLDHQRDSLGHSPGRIAAEMRQMLDSRECYLRLGLARGWATYPDRCYIQITGVYAFPDYLEGRTFADFAPDSPQPAVAPIP